MPIDSTRDALARHRIYPGLRKELLICRSLIDWKKSNFSHFTPLCSPHKTLVSIPVSRASCKNGVVVICKEDLEKTSSSRRSILHPSWKRDKTLWGIEPHHFSIMAAWQKDPLKTQRSMESPVAKLREDFSNRCSKRFYGGSMAVTLPMIWCCRTLQLFQIKVEGERFPQLRIQNHGMIDGRAWSPAAFSKRYVVAA